VTAEDVRTVTRAYLKRPNRTTAVIVKPEPPTVGRTP
jgi:hypothetical protein